MAMPASVRIVEVGPRDGLQNEKNDHRHRRQDRTDRPPVRHRPAHDRSDELRQPEVGAAAGRCRRCLPRHPPRRRRRAIRCSCPTSRATNARARSAPSEVAVFTAASEAFNRKNINASIDESHRTLPSGARARQRRRRARARLRVDRARLPLPGRGAGRRRGARRRTAAWAGLLRDFARRHHRRRHAGQGARDVARRRRRGADVRARRALPRHLRPGTVEHARLPRGRRARSSTPPSPAPAVVPTRRAPAATSPPRTSSTCCTGWASKPASTWRDWPKPVAGSRACSDAKAAARSGGRWRRNERPPACQRLAATLRVDRASIVALFDALPDAGSCVLDGRHRARRERSGSRRLLQRPREGIVGQPIAVPDPRAAAGHCVGARRVAAASRMQATNMPCRRQPLPGGSAVRATSRSTAGRRMRRDRSGTSANAAKAELHYRELMEMVDKGIVVRDVDGNIVYANAVASRLFRVDEGIEPAKHCTRATGKSSTRTATCCTCTTCRRSAHCKPDRSSTAPCSASTTSANAS